MNKHTATSSSIAEFYDGYYGDSELSEWRILGGRDKGGRLVQLCSDVPHQTVLEVGAGDGAVIADLAQRGFGERLTAVEISDSGLALLKNRTIPRLEAAHKFDGYHLPFEDNSFDLAYAVHVLEHVEHERIFLREAARVASVLYIEVPLEATVRVSRAIDNDIGHINFYNRHILRGLLESCGLKIIKLEVRDHSPAVNSFGHSPISGAIRTALRSTGMALLPKMAEQLFVYNGCAVCIKHQQ